MRWNENSSVSEWDKMLGEIGGHPLQSALWGEAKRAVYGIEDTRYAIYENEKLMALIRVEKKGFRSWIKLGWIPHGPVVESDEQWQKIEKNFFAHLKKTKHALCVWLPWKSVDLNQNNSHKKMRKTVWVDLQVGKEALWMGLDKQWRYGVRSAERSGLKIETAHSDQSVADFYRLCIALSNKKTFDFQHSEAFLRYLLNHSSESGVEAKLFLAKSGDAVAAGAFVLRVGKHCHYMWGAMDRQYSKLRPGEFVQWAVMEWACEKKCTLYDLEGIDEENNPGVSAFKKKMGGVVITLPGFETKPFNIKGICAAKWVRKKLNAG